MNSKTKKLIEHLAGLGNREELKRVIGEQHDKTKLTLSDKGYRFTEGYEDLEGGQRVTSRRDLVSSEYYEELNYIRRGLSDRWSDNLSDYDRHKEIRDGIIDILNHFE